MKPFFEPLEERIVLDGALLLDLSTTDLGPGNDANHSDAGLDTLLQESSVFPDNQDNAFFHHPTTFNVSDVMINPLESGFGFFTENVTTDQFIEGEPLKMFWMTMFDDLSIYEKYDYLCCFTLFSEDEITNIHQFDVFTDVHNIAIQDTEMQNIPGQVILSGDEIHEFPSQAELFDSTESNRSINGTILIVLDHTFIIFKTSRTIIM